MTALPAAVATYLDAMTFAMAVAVVGIAGESNPLVRSVGPGGALLAKAGFIALLPFADRALRRPWLMALVAVAGAIGAGTNVAALLRG